MKHTTIALALLVFAGSAGAWPSLVIKEVIKGGDLDRPGMIYADIEDTNLQWSLTDTTRVPEDVNGDSWCLIVGPEWGRDHILLIGVPDFLDIISSRWHIGSRDDIISVTMRIRHRSPMGGETIGVYRVTTPWLAPGAEQNVTAVVRSPGSDDPYWAADTGKTPGVDTEGNPTYDDFVGFSSADYTTEDAMFFTIGDPPGPHNTAHDIDITEIVRDWYSEGNQGLCLVQDAPWWQDSDAPYFQPSEQDSTWDILEDGSSPAIEFIFLIPEPVTIGLLAVGSLVLLRRKR